MRITDMDVEHLDFVARCGYVGEAWQRPEEIAEILKKWIRERVGRGMVVKVALDGCGKPLAFVRALPVELCAWGIKGKNLLAVTCIMADSERARKAGPGTGSELMKALESDARKNYMGLCTMAYDIEFPFMPYGFFKKLGFVEVARRPNHSEVAQQQGDQVIMLKEFEPVASPEFKEICFTPELIPGKIVIDLIWNPLCLTSVTELMTVRKVCASFKEKVILKEYCTGDPEVCSKCGTERALYINGKLKNWGYDVPEQELIRCIREAVKI